MKTFISTLSFLFFVLHVFAAAPTISSFSPTSGRTGSTITINGTNFTPGTTVTFGGVAASSVTYVSPTQITAVVAQGNSGAVSASDVDGTGSLNGFIYLSTSRIITDFKGYWSAAVDAPNATAVDSSHMLLGFTYRGVTYSTGVNDAVLTSKGVGFTPGNFRALPVAGISGVTSGGAVYIALAKKVDGSENIANVSTVNTFTLKKVLVDGVNGLDLGTGFTNLPASALLTFSVFSIDPTKIDDNEPDLILTQIAQPASGNDHFQFVDGSGAAVGNAVTQDMSVLPRFGTYGTDLFNLTPATPYNAAAAYSASVANDSKEIRLVGFRLADFGINAGNVALIKALKITPSSNSDYAFIAYNANSINLPPNVSRNDAATNTDICSGGTARLSVIATPVMGNALSYNWQQSTDGGSTWNNISNGGDFSGAASNTLSVASATHGHKFRAIVQEAGNSSPATSQVFTIAVVAPAPPSWVTVSGGNTVCLNSSLQLTSSVSGGSNLFYQWQSNSSGSYADIPGATLDTYVPSTSQTGATSYRVRVSSGSGCGSVTATTPATVTINGIASTTPTEVCSGSPVTLAATATSGTISWYDVDNGGAALTTGTSYSPSITASKTYYVASSGCASALRVPVTATVNPTTSGGSISGAATVTPGVNSTTLTLNSNVGAVQKWQSSTDNFNSSIVDITNTSNQLTVNNLSQTTHYRVEVKSGTCASAYSPTATILVTGTLAIHQNSVQASRQGSAVLVQWTAGDQQHTTRFELERSADGVVFTKIASITAIKSANNNTVSCQWKDGQPLEGVNFYRVKEVFVSGSSSMSAIVSVIFSDVEGKAVLYPNPVTNGTFQVQFTGVEAGNYVLRVYNTTGQKLLERTFSHVQGSAKHNFTLPSQLAKGVYKVELSGSAQFKKHFTVLLK